MDAVEYGAIASSPDYLQRLRELVHSIDELQRAGYVLAQFSPSELERKKRCERCCRILNKGDKFRPRGSRAAPTVTSGAPSAGPGDPSRYMSTLATQESRADDEVDDMISDLTVSLGNKSSAKPDGTVLRCKFHPGRVADKAGTSTPSFNPQDVDLLTLAPLPNGQKWTCCSGHMFAKPCAGENHHSPRRYSAGELERNWKFYPTPPAASPSPAAAVVTIDCEMGTAASGESELIRVSVVDYFSRQVLLDSLVWPEVKMAHYNTKYSGISRQMMEGARRRRSCLVGRDEARRAVWRVVSPETIVVGHAGQQDLTCLRWIHPLVVDTLVVETKRRRDEHEADEAAKMAAAEANGDLWASTQAAADNGGDDKPAPKQQEGGLSLKALALQRLCRTIQIKGRGHDSVEDAIATRDLLHWHVSHATTTHGRWMAGGGRQGPRPAGAVAY